MKFGKLWGIVAVAVIAGAGYAFLDGNSGEELPAGIASGNYNLLKFFHLLNRSV